jgi:hypothetical protein
MINQIFLDIECLFRIIYERDDSIVEMEMPDNSINTLVGIFPEWLKTIVMITIAMVSSAVVSLAKSKYAGAFKFSIWIVNILLSMVMAFLVDSLALWIEPELNVRAEMVLMVLTGMLAKDILEIAEHKGLSWIRWKVDGGSSGN